MAYFRATYDLDTKDEQVELYLSAFVALYDALSEGVGSGSAPAKRCGPGPDLISPHS